MKWRGPNEYVEMSNSEALQNGSSPTEEHARLSVRKSAMWFRRAADPSTLVLLALIAVLWLATRPYRGVYHDSRFYAIEALNILLPGRFAQDLYFQFGSVGEYTIYPRIFAPLISLLGLSAASIALTIASQILWLFALFRLASALVRDRTRMLLSVAAVIALPAAYGLLGYGEAWVTPRVFVEALTLLALSYFVQRLYGRAVLILVFAVALHPLMAIAGLAFMAVYLALEWPLWWMAVLGAGIVAFGLASMGVRPFVDILNHYDHIWLDILRFRDPYCLVMEWRYSFYFHDANTFVLGAMGLFVADKIGRRLLASGLIVGLGGILSTLIGGDFFHNVFVVEVQPWRAMWLITVLANFYTVSLFVRLLREGERLDLVRLAFGVAALPLLLSQFIQPFVFVAAPLIAIAAGIAAWQLTTGHRLSRLERLLSLCAIAVTCVETAVMCYGYKIQLAVAPDEFKISSTSSFLTVAALILMLVALTQRRRRDEWITYTIPFVATALLGIALYHWDMRTSWEKFIESPPTKSASLASFVPKNSSVYWEGGLEMLWFRLHRSSYFSCDQSSASMYYRGNAIEYWHRAQSFWELRTPDFGMEFGCGAIDDHIKPDRTRSDLQSVCRQEPSLDYLVLLRPIKEVDATKVWTSPAAFRTTLSVNGRLKSFSTHSFYLYSCAAFR